MQRKKIVLADDVELFLMLEKTFFNREEFELITARNGEEALKAIQETNPDLVFLDLHMPDMNGDECCRIVKQNGMYRHIPIVMVTTAGREEDLERCRCAGCDDIVNKPIDRHVFIATAQRLLEVAGRGTQRFNVRLRVHYGAEAHALLCDYSIDLSTGGLFLACEDPLPRDTPLSMEFILPTSENAIRCNARVAWVNDQELRRKSALPTGMGVQFLDLTLSDMDAIREYIKSFNLEPAW
jgi:uncharacterized protein (TIGR02266 family)